MEEKEKVSNADMMGDGRAQDQSCAVGLSSNWAILELKTVLQEDKTDKRLMCFNTLWGYLHRWKRYVRD